MVPGKKCGQKVWGSGEYWCIAKGENIIFCGSNVAIWFSHLPIFRPVLNVQVFPERACAELHPRAGRWFGGRSPNLGPHLLLS
jgi:hypothetical protein